MPTAESDWDRAKGVECPRCGGEAHRLLPILVKGVTQSVCRACAARLDAEQAQVLEDRAAIRELKDSLGLGPRRKR